MAGILERGGYLAQQGAARGGLDAAATTIAFVMKETTTHALINTVGIDCPGVVVLGVLADRGCEHLSWIEGGKSGWSLAD